MLHIFALVGIAVAQPIYSALAGGPEFLVAHNASSLDITAFVFVLSVGLPLAVILVEALVRLVSLPMQRGIHLGVVWALLVVLALQTVNRFFGDAVVTPVVLATMAATICVALYARSMTARRLVSILAIGSVLFPLHFLFMSPVSKAFSDENAQIVQVDASNSTAPVIFVIFDEFNPTALLKENGEIDAVRFPHFAELSKSGWWFPHATSTHPQTQFAVPAILTGALPSREKDAPTYKTHPKNLFTMLGGSYSLNVHETLTSLCSSTMCTAKKEAFDPSSFASDIYVAFQHAIFPRALAAEILPPLDAGWNNFQAGAAPREASAESHDVSVDQEKLLIETFKKNANRSRLATFRDFISSINGGEKRLDFIHLLLPHQPYQFFPDGAFYQGVSDIGLTHDVWTADQHVIDVAYSRYLMQVGLVDSLVGELMQRLKDVGIYDKALIVITGDHGRAFTANVNSRALTEKNADVLHVPLFIKTPGQKSGGVNPMLVSNIDIVPTIADVLGIDVDWTFDGESVFAKNRTESDVLNVQFQDETFKFDRNVIVGTPLLDWQAKTFGSGTSLADLSISSPYNRLLGTDTRSLDVAEPPPGDGLRLTQNFSAFEAIDTRNGYIPALVSSEVIGLHSEEKAWIALALNGKIAAVTPAYKDINDTQRILTLLPQNSFTDGRNILTAFVIDPSDELGFIPIGTTSERYSLESKADGSDLLLSSGGEAYPIVTGKTFGTVDIAEVDGSTITLAGWSAEIDKLQPAKLVVAFINGEFACAVSPTVNRVDVAEAFKSSDVAASGFSTQCPFKGDSLAPSSLRAFAITPSGAVGELRDSGK
ncbi:hypothetical protein ASD64_14620 [Mesorhizobium sp. Root157]|nr:hypothetical protein ASD64_14620 [Mesorhizobium sp. Root157]